MAKIAFYSELQKEWMLLVAFGGYVVIRMKIGEGLIAPIRLSDPLPRKTINSYFTYTFRVVPSLMRRMFTPLLRPSVLIPERL